MNSSDRARLIDAVKHKPLTAIVSRYVKMKRSGGGDKYKGLCPFHSERTPSFEVNDRRGRYVCYGCGASGTVIDFVMETESLSFLDALDRAAAFYGLVPDATGFRRKEMAAAPRVAPEDEERKRRLEIEAAQRTFMQGQDAYGTMVQNYLQNIRKIPLDKLPGGIVPPVLRFHPMLDYWYQDKIIGRYPAMVAAMENIAGIQTAVHITFLDPRTGDKIKLQDPANPKHFLPAKKMRGSAWAAAIRLAPAAEKMGVGEGIENTLTGMAMTGVPGWAAGSLGNLAGFGLGDGKPHPRRLDRRLPDPMPDREKPAFNFPDTTTAAIIWADNDSKDAESAAMLFERAGRRLSRTPAGKRVIEYSWPEKGNDWNKMLMAAAATETVDA